LQEQGPKGWTYDYSGVEKTFIDSDGLSINFFIKNDQVNNLYISHYIQKSKCIVIAKLFIAPGNKTFADEKNAFNLDIIIVKGEIISYYIFFFS
jgi:hypothetical protein